MSRNDVSNPPSTDLAAALAGVAGNLRRSFCRMLQDEIDLLAGNVIEINLLCRALPDSHLAVRLAGISDVLDGLRAEKVALAAHLGCVLVPDTGG